MAINHHTLSQGGVDDFHDVVMEYYAQHQRNLAWRQVDSDGIIDPYEVTVSEIMLQQTQVSRVEQKFKEFMAVFPDITSLADAELSDVLRVWSGLGYNRRAKYLHDFAKGVAFKGFPQDIDELTSYKGIGFNTAAAILVYAFDQRHVFIETNIRTVFLHHFYTDNVSKVTDSELLSLVNVTLPERSVREWYWALMDYGTYLKKQGLSNLNKSKNHKKQSTFKGSLRELRARIVRELLTMPMPVTSDELVRITKDPRTGEALQALVIEGLVAQVGEGYKV